MSLMTTRELRERLDQINRTYWREDMAPEHIQVERDFVIFQLSNLGEQDLPPYWGPDPDALLILDEEPDPQLEMFV